MTRMCPPVITTALVVLGTLAVSPAVAQGPRPPVGMVQPLGGQGGPTMPPEAMLMSLLVRSANLTSDQEARLRTVMSARQVTIRTLVEQLRKAEDDLADRLFAPGSADVQASVVRVSQLRDQILQESTRAALEVRGVLTAEQLTRAAYVKDRMRSLQAEMQQLLTQPPKTP